jgi:hypothetical protein
MTGWSNTLNPGNPAAVPGLPVGAAGLHAWTWLYDLLPPATGHAANERLAGPAFIISFAGNTL